MNEVPERAGAFGRQGVDAPSDAVGAVGRQGVDNPSAGAAGPGEVPGSPGGGRGGEPSGGGAGPDLVGPGGAPGGSGGARGAKPSAGWDLGHLRAGGAVTAGLAATAGPLVWLLRDGRAALWVLAGLAIVAAFFSVSAAAVAWAGKIADELTLPVALTAYVIKIVLLGVLLVTVRDSAALDAAALAWSVIGGTVAWTGVHLRRVWTARLYYVDP